MNSNMNNMNKGPNDAMFSTWKESSGWHDAAEANAMLNDLNEDGTALWNKRPAGPNAGRWKEDGNDLLMMNKSKLNNMTNQCANGINLNLNLNAHMQNGFSSASPGVLRIPSANSMNNKLQAMQANPNSKAGNWLEPSNSAWPNENKNGLANGPANGSGGMFWNEPSNTQQLASNWNKSNLNSNDNDWKLKKEMIMQSHQFKVLADRGFRKENIETALRNCNMNIKDAIDELRADVLKENCNDLDKRKNSTYNHPSSLPPNSSISNRNTSQFSNQMSQQVGAVSGWLFVFILVIRPLH